MKTAYKKRRQEFADAAFFVFCFQVEGVYPVLQKIY